ncbi:hypothetical protein VIOLETTEMAD_1 [Bacillus phage VioletteMad]|uniref:Uncharacterized protein n=1 Tax=Bacillus phage VioletteMad TaxID=2023952 RepID=A0A514AAN3_9CAUD|nr:hypothetical protein VIOLETTEMAD_1 [Bacillus phage VioletteMad]
MIGFSTVKRADKWWVLNMPCNTVRDDFTRKPCESNLTVKLVARFSS